MERIFGLSFLGGLTVVLLLVILGATNTERSKCTIPIAVDEDHDVYYSLGTRNSTLPVSIFYDRDTTGTNTDGSLTIKACMDEEDANSCADLDYDSTGNGVPDTNVIDGETTASSGVRGISGFPFLRVEEEEAATGTDFYVICRGF